MRRFFLCTLGIVLDVAALAVWVVPTEWGWEVRLGGALMHALGCVILGWAWTEGWQSFRRSPKAVFQVLIAFFFPGFGMIAAMVMDQQPALTVDEMKALQSKPKETDSPTLLRLSEPFWFKAAEIQPITDILATNDLDLKREAIRRLSARYDANSVRLLRRALLDPQGEIRLYAVNALSKIEETLLQALSKSNGEVERHPRLLSAWMQLGFACCRYAKSGVLESTLQTMYLQKALRIFEKARKLFPENAAPLVEELRTARDLKREDQFQSLMQRAQSRFPNDPTVRLFYAEQLFDAGHWLECQTTLAGVDAKTLTQEQVSLETMELWRIST